jgi:hypothetical protein
MVVVCKVHVNKGLKDMVTPHVQKLPEKNNFKCAFCQTKGDFKLFYLPAFYDVN